MFSLLKEWLLYRNHPRNLSGKVYVQVREDVFVLQAGQRYSLSLSAVEYMVWISCFNSILILFSPVSHQPDFNLESLKIRNHFNMKIIFFARS